MIPRSRNKHYMCIICGMESRSIVTIAQHIELEHEHEEQKRFGLGSVSDIQKKVAKNYQPHAHSTLKVANRFGKPFKTIQSYEWPFLYNTDAIIP